MQVQHPLFLTSLLTIGVAALGVLGSIASIQATWGDVGLLGSLVLSIGILLLIWLPLTPMFRVSFRGRNLLSSVQLTGLTDIENREESGLHALPPGTFYEAANFEIVILGISNYGTLSQHRQLLIDALKANKSVHVVFLHPDSPDAKKMSAAEGRTMPQEIGVAIDSMYGSVRVARQLAPNRPSLFSFPKFKVYYLATRPPYTGIMIDGDAFSTTPNDDAGEIRIQPSASFQSQHKGIVLQFQKKSVNCGFTYFSNDLRQLLVSASAYEPRIPNEKG